MATPIPKNRARFTLGEIVRATGGTPRGGDAGILVEGVTTDSREGVAGKLFVALSGERFDGHRFAAEAVRSGARAVLARRGVPIDASVPVVEVDDTLDALGALGRWHRRRWGRTVIGVAGSAGKTTTRSTIAAALEAVFPAAVHRAPGNLNNRIGVPMVLLGLAPEHAVGVVEIGTNTRGEVAALAAMAEPNVGVLTLVDLEHAAGLGDLDAIEEEEGALLRALPRGGSAIANGDDERAVRQLLGSRARRKVTYGVRGMNDYRIVRRDPVRLGASRIAIERPRGRSRETLSLEVPLVGSPGALAVAAALAVADRVAGRTVPADRLAGALAIAAVGEPGRLRPVELADGTVVVDDSYNANPASVRAAVETAREIAEDRGARLVLVVGEMRELGAGSAAAHASIGRDLGATGAAVLVAVGGDAEGFVGPAAALGVDAVFAVDAGRAVVEVLRRLRSGDVVLVKASRGVGAELVVERLVHEKGSAA
jgi:UDP-N-acetylmuramoyl-tripeptide--D-alanyl-D-alanine ligase